MVKIISTSGFGSDERDDDLYGWAVFSESQLPTTLELASLSADISHRETRKSIPKKRDRKVRRLLAKNLSPRVR